MSDETQKIFDQLAAPFPSECVAWRVGPTNDKSRKPDDPVRGQPLAYIDARTVMDRLDAVVGWDCWQNSYSAGVGSSIVCNIGVRIANDWIWKSDGAGASDTEPEKGMLSDAFKRAAVRFGIGRYLYELHAPWIVLAQRGKFTYIPDDVFPKLAALHDREAKRLRGPQVA